MKDYSGEDFLNKLYKDLHMSDVVMHTANPSDSPREKIGKYMERLERVHNSNNESIKNYVKNLYHQKYIIKEENLPSYLSEEQKKHIIDAQIKTFDMWLNYLTDENSKYPMWAKYWVFQGMLKIGTYDEATDTYKKRTEKTINPFIEANPEVIAKCIYLIVNRLNKPISEINVGEEGLNKLIESGSFQKIYTTLIKEQNKKQYQRSGFEGKWIKYNYNSEEDAIKLYNSLQGYGTNWCTAGSEQVAINQICGGEGYQGGDFYVYYTLDDNNEYKIPRIAIRMDGTKNIDEIRGVADASQNLEDGMESIIERKLNEFTFLSKKNSEEYMRSINNCRMLTKLNQKTSKKEELTLDEYMFIFEINSSIIGFGWETDPRVEKIRNNNIIKNYETAVKLIKIKGLLLKYVSEELQNNSELVKLAVTQSGGALRYASEELKSNPEIVRLAVTQSGGALEYASLELRKNPEIVRLAVTQNGMTLRYASLELRKNPEIIKLAVTQSGGALRYASEELKSNPEIVRLAVTQSGYALEYASLELRKNPEIVRLAVTQNGMTLRYASEDLQNNLDIVRLAVTQNGMTLRYASEELQNNPDIVRLAVTQNSMALRYASEELKNNFQFVKEMVMQNGTALIYASEELQNNPDIVKSAVVQNPEVLKYYSYLQRLAQIGIEEMQKEHEMEAQGKSR